MAWWSSALTPSQEGARSIPYPGNPYPTLGIGTSPLFWDLAARFSSILNMARLVPKNRTPCKNWWRDSKNPIHKEKSSILSIVPWDLSWNGNFENLPSASMNTWKSYPPSFKRWTSTATFWPKGSSIRIRLTVSPVHSQATNIFFLYQLIFHVHDHYVWTYLSCPYHAHFVAV